MSNEKLYRGAEEFFDRAAPQAHGVPGKLPATARLSGGPRMIFRVESAEAAQVFADAFGPRDGNGVAADSEAAVDRAASSNGSALPPDLQGRFEASLGADLSSVRLHTGSESAQAASAVGARAYTAGQDIHFGAGHYDPSSAFGVHLIAHEVAHTVQQQGAAPTRQHKLEVSSPGDHHEVEADRAADAMVAGQPASVSSAGGLARKLYRKEYDGTGPLVPTPYDADAGEGVEGISGNWSREPSWIVAAPYQGSGETFDSLAGAKSSFKMIWIQVEMFWNMSVPHAKRYMDAQKDAEAKGLADFGGEGGNVGVNSDAKKNTKGTSVADAFDPNGQVLKPGQKAFDSGKVDEGTKEKIVAAKKTCKDADRTVGDQTLLIEGTKTDLDTAKSAVNVAVASLHVEEDSQQIAKHERQAATYKKCADLINTSIDLMGGAAKGGAAKKGEGAGDLIDVGVGAAKIINTLIWEAQIEKIETQIQVLQGGIDAIKVSSAKEAIRQAMNTLKKAQGAVKLALSSYDKVCSDRAEAYRKLGDVMRISAKQSLGSDKDADRVATAIQHLPLLEFAHTAAQELHDAIPKMPGARPEAEKGCTLARNRDELIFRYATLKTAKQVAKNQVTFRAKQVAAVQKIINSAHD